MRRQSLKVEIKIFNSLVNRHRLFEISLRTTHLSSPGVGVWRILGDHMLPRGSRGGSVVCNRVKRKDHRKLTTNENGSLDYYKILLGNHVILIQ